MLKLPPREVIGAPGCPLFYRWTLRPWGVRSGHAGAYRWKLVVHKFLAHADDRDAHDHPRPFWSLVLRGYYDDLAPCPGCHCGLIVTDPQLARDPQIPKGGDWMPCPVCETPEEGPTGFVIRERMRAGMIRYRPAEHAHRTRVGPDGCWTIVLMGPLQRPWGFWRRGRWWFWRDYEDTFGLAMRCDDDGS